VLRGKLQQLKTQHIYREYNEEGDQLSKQEMQMEENEIYYAMDT